MILSRLIVRWLEWIIEIGLWIFLITAFFGGLSYGSGFLGSLVAAIISVIVTGVMAAVLFGFFIVLNDIRTMLKRAIEAQGIDTR